MLFQCVDLSMYMSMSSVCPRSSDQLYIVSYYINWITTSWIYSMSFALFKQKQTLKNKDVLAL